MITVPAGFFVELKRSFHELAKQAHPSDDFDLSHGFVVGPALSWDDLLRGFRTVILSEAGSGKTEEIRQAAARIRAEGRPAFFLRLEHIPEDFEEAFEIGTEAEFAQWLSSTEEGWVLLDSVDEARLRSPADFEAAIRRLGRRIQSAAARVHIVITGRPHAWRARTDLELCQRHFPIAPKTAQIAVQSPPVDGELDPALDPQPLDIKHAEGSQHSGGFRIVAFDDLSMPQVRAFALALGVTDTEGLLNEIERAEAESFAARPQDLQELVEFWNKSRRIGTRLELMTNSVQRRLEEREQNRREARPLSALRSREGARLLAAASIMGKESTIQVPDGSHGGKGIAVGSVLPDWDDRDQQTLLSRPIFDGAIYGTVRFHHRPVREFLAAEWLSKLLERNASRRSIESLLFHEQYGLEVVVPAMRPVLAWLAILDERICERTLRVAPEILFEGGDPSALPLPMRQALLSRVCGEIAPGAPGRATLDYAAVQRFASPDLAEDIRKLLTAFSSSPDVVNLLARMIWLGRITALRAEAKALALTSTLPQYTRRAAIRALRAVGTTDDLDDLRSSFEGESDALDREWLSEIVASSSPNAQTSSWLLRVLSKAAPKERFGVDSLTDTLSDFAKVLPGEFQGQLAEGLHALLNEAPFVERWHCRVSAKNSWLIEPASIVVEQLIRDRRAAALGAHALGILHKFRAIMDWDDGLRGFKAEFEKLVPAWPELNRAAFWHDIREARASEHFVTPGQRLTYYWQVGVGAHWAFGPDDFDYAVRAILECDALDDKLVALSLAHAIWMQSKKPDSKLKELRGMVRGNQELEERLDQLLSVPASEHTREEAKWKKRAAARERRERNEQAESKAFILSNVELVRAAKLDSPSAISNAQWYLHEQLRQKSKNGSRWTIGRWRELIPEFGEPVALAYREGVLNYWRRYTPPLRSEGAPANSTPIPVIFGLSGLDIEAAETAGWPSNLSDEEVRLACRYAANELNGFPPWFPKLFSAHREIVGGFLLAQIVHEIGTASGEESTDLLNDVSWSGQWSWDYLAQPVFALLRDKDIANFSAIEKLLKVIQSSSDASDADLSALARTRVESASDSRTAATWFAVWAGASPDDAVPALSAYLAAMPDAAQQTQLAMYFVATLLGGRRSGQTSSRRRFATPVHLKELFLLMQMYVREDEDIERAGKGVYSPGLRDDAQDARNALFNILKAIPGKEAFVALCEIGEKHPKADTRRGIASYARSRAEQDAEITPWTPASVRDFHDHLERTPTNHRELAELAVLRLLDLKDDLEDGDESVARILLRVKEEPEMRNFLARELRSKAFGRYTVTQEEELADGKRPDLRFHGAGFDAAVPVELKLAERWSGPKLFERLEGQLSGDYLRDVRSAHGIFVLVHRAPCGWKLPSGQSVHLNGLLEGLRAHWKAIAGRNPHVDELTVIGIDLSRRFD